MLDAQVERYLAWRAETGAVPLDQAEPAEARRASEAEAAGLYGPVEEVASVADGSVAGVPVRVYDPEPGRRLPLIVYLHGGGWVTGSVRTHDGPCRGLANRAGCRIVSVDYRLAPEHPFPAALEDAWAVAGWASGQAPAVAVGGDSAGGNLAAAVALRARDHGLRLALQLLIYPVTDHDFTTPSYRAKATGFGLTQAAMRWYWAHYLGGGDGGQPEASPLRAASLAGTAPALVVVAEHDPLRDEGVAYAERLRADGVPVRLSEYRGMIHGFVRMAAWTDRTRSLLDECAAGLREAFAGQPGGAGSAALTPP